jgi:serine/threonine-protein kinase
VVEIIGRGGMGVVYKAADERLGITVAIKMLHAHLLGDAGAERATHRFLREARLAAQIVHENVVGVRFAGEQDGAPFLVLDYVPGGSVAELLGETGPLPWRRAAKLGAQIARGLAAIHARGLMHRDLKPANVLLDANGTAKVTDFGVARRVDATSIALTKTGDVVGTFEYLSPEQASASKDVNERADLYALGGTLFAMLTGEPPFQAESPMFLLAKHASERPRSPRELVPDLPRPIEKLILQLLEKDPKARPSAEDTAVALEEALRPPAPEKPVAPERATPSRALLALGAMALGGIVLGLGILIGGSRTSSPSAAPSAPAPSSAPEKGGSPSPSPRLESPVEEMRRAYGSSPTLRLANVLGGPELKSGTAGELVYLPDGKRIVRAGATLEVFSAETGQRLQRLARSYVETLAALPDGRHLVTLGAERLLWDLDKGTVEHEFPGAPYGSGVTRVTLSRDGTLVLFAVPGVAPCLCSTSTGKLAVEFSQGPRPRCAVLSPDGAFVLAGDEGGELWRWDVATRDRVGLGSRGAPITALAISPDGKRAASSDGTGAISVWNLDSPARPVVPISTRARAHPALQLVFSNDGSFLVSRYEGVNPASEQPPLETRVFVDALGPTGAFADERALEGNVFDIFGIAVSPDDSRIATAGWDGTVRVFDSKSGRAILEPRGHVSWLPGLAVSGDGKTVVTGGWDGTVRTWDLATGTQQRTFRIADNFFVERVALSPRADRIAACTKAGPLSIIELAAPWAEPKPLPGSGPDSHAAFSPDGRKLLAGSSSGSLRLWDLESSAPPSDLADPRGAAVGYSAVAFLSDERALAGTRDGRVEVVDLQNGQEGIVNTINVAAAYVARGRFRDPKVLSLGVAPDGLRCAALFTGGGVAFFDAVMNFTQNPGLVSSEAIQGAWMRGMAMSLGKNARLVAAASEDGTIKLFDVRAGVELGGYTFPKESGDCAASLAFVPPDGRTLLVGTYSGVVLQFEVTLGH